MGIPLAAFIVAALLLALGVLWTPWKRRKPPVVVVSFLAFWTPSPTPRLPRLKAVTQGRWMWWLTLAAAGASLFAAADLRPTPTIKRGRHVLVLVDEATLRGSQGAAQSLATALAVLDTLHPADRVAVVGFDERPRVIVPWQHDPSAARRRLQAITAPPKTASQELGPPPKNRNLEDALVFAQAMTAGRARPEVIVVGPGGYSHTSGRALSQLPLRWARAASHLGNVAVTSFAATRMRNTNVILATLRLRNHNQTKVTVRATIYDVSPAQERTLVHEANLTLQPQEERALTTSLAQAAQASRATTLSLQLEAPPQRNAFAHDDEATLVLATPRPATVLIVGARNRYLEAALRSLSRQVAVSHIESGALESSRSLWPQVDLVVFNEVAPSAVPQAGSFLYFLHAQATSTSTGPWRLGALLDQPVISHSAPMPQKLLQHMNLRGLNVKRARAVRLEDGTQALASAYGQALVAWRQTSQVREVGFGFSLRQSDLVWRPELPLLLENLLEAFAPADPESAHVLLTPPHPQKPNNDRLFEGGVAAVPLWEPASPPTPMLAAGRRRPARIALGLACVCGAALMMAHMARPRGDQQVVVMAVQLLALGLVVTALAGPSLTNTRPSGYAALIVDARQALQAHQLRAVAELQSKLGAAVASPLQTWAFGPAAQLIPRATTVADHHIAQLWAQAALPVEGTSALLTATQKSLHPNEPPSLLNQIWALPPSHKGDVALGAMLTPAMVAPHQRFGFQLPIIADADGVVTLELKPDSVLLDPSSQALATPLAAGRFRISVKAGTTWLSFVAQGAPSPGAPLHATVIATHPPANNQRPQNDVAYAHPVVRQQPRVLLLADVPARVEAFARALTAQAFDVVTRTPKAPPAPEDFDLVVLSDLARDNVADAWLLALANAVDKGVGLLVAGGPTAFAGGGWAASRLAAMLPVTLDVPAPRPVADLALALVVDRSGSMGGAKIDLTREAVRATSAALRASDLLTVIAFDSRADTLVPLQHAANRPRIWAQMERLAAGGGTNIMPALQEAYQTLLGAAAQRRHIIVLSDGHAPAAQLPQLLADIAAAQITISSVAVGRGADVGLLRRLADAGGGRLHITDDASRIPRIFAMDVAQAEPRFAAQSPRRVRPRGGERDLGKLDWARAPALRGVTLVRARKQANLLLETNRSEPVFVSWNVGAGQVGAFAADLAGPWLATWPRWVDYPKFWSAVARGLLRQDPARTYPIDVQAGRYGIAARLEVMWDDGTPRTELAGFVQLRPATQATDGPAPWQAELRETVPGVYQAWLPPLPPFGNPPVAARLDAWLKPDRDQGGDPGILGIGHVAWPQVDGFAPNLARPPDPHANARALSQTLARLATARSHHEMPLAPWLAALASLLFVAAIAVPRATFRASKN